MKRLLLLAIACLGLQFSINAQTAINSFPYFSDFETDDGGWTADPSSEWVWDTPNKSFISEAYSGDKAWITGATGRQANNQTNILLSPTFDFSNINTPIIFFKLWYNAEPGFDGTVFEYTIDGSNWNVIGAATNFYRGNGTQLLGPAWSGGNSYYETFAIGIGALSGESSVQFRFRSQTNGSQRSEGFAIDDFIVSGYPPALVDLEVIGTDIVANQVCESNSRNIVIYLKNNHSQSINGVSFSLSYQVDNEPVVTESISGIGQQSTVFYTFNTRHTFTRVNSRVRAWVNFNFGTTFSNDTITRNHKQQSPVDVEVAELRLPSNGSSLSNCSGSSSTPVEIVIRNHFPNEIFGTSFSYRVNGGNIITETNPGGIQPFCLQGAFNFRFNAPINFTQDGTYEVEAWSNFPVDSVRSNDTVRSTVRYVTGVQLPFFENFDGLTSGTGALNDNATIPTGWDAFDDFGNSINSWGARSTASETPQTGPTAPFNGQGNYMLLEGNSFSGNNFQNLVTPCIQIPNSGNDIVLDFMAHLYGADIQNFVVFVFSFNTGTTQSFSVYSNTNQISSNDPFKRVIINLNQYKGDNISLFFAGRSNGGALSDMAIDNIAVYESAADNLGIQSFDAPIDESCGIQSDTSISVTIFNYGQNPVSQFDICYQINNGSPVCENVSGGVLMPGNSIQYQFSTAFDAKIPGDYAIKVYLQFPSDSISFNDSSFAVFTNTTNALPYVENFDQINLAPWTTDNSSVQWLVNSGGTNSFNTGPSADADGNASGQYYYLETSAGSPAGSEAYLEDPGCYNLSNTSTAHVEYQYHMYGGNMGTLYLEVLANDTVAIDTIDGPQQTSSTEVWGRRKIALPQYAGQVVSFRFRAVSRSGEQGDMAIDNFGVGDSTISIQEYQLVDNLVSLFPNPSNGILHIQSNDEPLAFVEVYTPQGQMAQRKQLGNLRNFQWELPKSKGIYWLRIVSRSGKIQQAKVIRQ